MSKMQETGIPPDKATCNILVQKCSIAGNASAIIHVLQHMKENSIVLRRPEFLQALKAFKTSCEIDHLLRAVNPHLAFEGIEETNLEPTSNDIHYVTDKGLLINLLSKKNFLGIEHMLYGMMKEETQLDSKLLSAVVRAYCANNRISGALLAFRYCLKMNKELDRSAYLSLLGLFIRTNSFSNLLEIVDEMINIGICFGTYLLSLLIRKLGCAGFSSVSAKIFHSLPSDQNVLTYTSLLRAYFQSGEVDKGLELYSIMRSLDIPLSHGTYEVLIVGLVDAGRIYDAEIYRKEKKNLQWHNYSPESLSAGESLCNCLFDRT